MIECLIEQKESLMIDEAEELWKGDELTIERKTSLKDYLNKPLYIISKNMCYGVIELKNERLENGIFLYDVHFLKRFESPVSVKYSLNNDGYGNIEFLAEGQTSQANVIGTGFTSFPLNPIWVINKRRKKRYRLDEEDFDEIEPDDAKPDDSDEDEWEIEDLSEVEKILRVVKRGDRWCVIHGHPKVPGSKTDKPEGSVIKCFPTKAEADRMHKAIIISKIKRGEMNEMTDFSDFLSSMKDIILIKDFISAVGSQVKNYTDEKPDDIDLQIRMKEPTSYIKRAVEVRILKQLPIDLQEKIHFIWGDPEGSHDDFIPLFDLKLEKLNSEIIKMDEETLIEKLISDKIKEVKSFEI